MTGASTASDLEAVSPLFLNLSADTDRKCASGFDIFYRFMGFGKVQCYRIPFLHGSPGGIHDIYTAVFIISCNHQDWHWENTFCDIKLSPHKNKPRFSVGIDIFHVLAYNYSNH